MKMKFLIILLPFMSLFACNQASKQDDKGPSQTGVYFVNLKDGDKVKSPVIIKMGVWGMDLEPAGDYNKGKGHHHLIIDGNYVEKGEMVPKDETHLHFGKGQTVDTLALNPGEHTLTLQFADGLHRSYGKDWSATIKITVIQ
ncbi:MAG TPA: DUF4399 domain-containing protein [Bacteroidia bacterium]|jgi:hypothetical protein|nr:DUF4399 domain-containing protein [Bacteroidia bacterium]